MALGDRLVDGAVSSSADRRYRSAHEKARHRRRNRATFDDRILQIFDRRLPTEVLGGGGEYPSVVINSIDPRHMLGLIDEGNYKGTVDYLVSALQVLADAGVDLALFASNTPHLLFDEIRLRSPLPLVSIVDASSLAISY